MLLIFSFDLDAESVALSWLSTFFYLFCSGIGARMFKKEPQMMKK